MTNRVPGTQGYAAEAEKLLDQYESFTFADLHAHILSLIPPAPARILDIGAGTGRDAAAFAAMGHRVTAVEPTAELRSGAMALHPSPLIEWLDDSLPDLVRVDPAGQGYDLVMLTAVWMHLDPAQRRRAMPRIGLLVRKGGHVAFTIRHGTVPPGRRMYEIASEETVALAAEAGLRVVLQRELGDGIMKRANVRWTRLAFKREED